jgi:ATP-dependent DNA helicase UvrD/PcrA
VIFSGLNPEQRRAVELARGSVCILAGAGTGKTTTITRRIANQVATGTFRAEEILAVTFTDKAAGELRSRLAALGAPGVQARTFHSAALAQLRYFAPDAVGRILPSKALTLRHIANSLPRPFSFRPAGDLATEIEWARNRRIPSDRYLAEVGEHVPPIPPDLMVKVYRRYEEAKRAQGFTDFEDLLELAIRLYDEDPHAGETFRDRYLAFTVDEYQDVNLLQQTLLERWLGDRDDLCAVGDDNQAIYGFTGAGPEYLLALTERAVVVRLEENYRSTPEVLALAGRLAPPLRTALPAGSEPVVRPLASADAEAAFVVESIRALACKHEEVAILCRTNSRLAEFEQALHEAGIASQGSAFLSREAARFVLRKLGDDGPVADRVRDLATSHGWLPNPPEGLGDREQTRQNDLKRLVDLAEKLAPATAGEFRAELERRFGTGGAERRGVHLLTYHAAKGLEFEAVFLPRLDEKELPIRQARTEAELAEERRLLYVGITRAKRHLALTWVKRPSRFLAELGASPQPQERTRGETPQGFEALKAWRLARSKADEVPAYVVFHNSTLEEIASRRPGSLVELAAVPGVGPAKLERYGEDVLAALSAAS